MKRSNLIFFVALSLSIIVTGCNKDNKSKPDPVGENREKYVIAATAADGISVYLLASDNATANVSIVGNGVESEGFTFVRQNNTLFGSTFSTSAQGPTIAYKLDNSGKIVKGQTINTPACHFATAVGTNSLLQVYTPAFAVMPTTTFTILDAVNPKISGTNSFNMFQMAGNGEMALLTGVFPKGNEIWAPYRTVKGITGNNYGTDYPDSTWVAIFKYPEMTVKKILRDSRTSFIGEAASQQGFEKVDNGDIYAFSSAKVGSKHSAVVRIKSETENFDQSYFYDLQIASGGLKYARAKYVGGTRFLVEMYTDQVISPDATSGNVKLAIVDVATKSFNWVKNAPTYSLSIFRTSTYVENDKNTIIIPIKDDATGVISLYQVDSSTAIATKGATIAGATAIYALTKLTY